MFDILNIKKGVLLFSHSLKAMVGEGKPSQQQSPICDDSLSQEQLEIKIYKESFAIVEEDDLIN